MKGLRTFEHHSLRYPKCCGHRCNRILSIRTPRRKHPVHSSHSIPDFEPGYVRAESMNGASDVVAKVIRDGEGG